MSEQARFQQWWESTGTNSVILRAQAWSAWLARAEADQPQPDPHIALMEAEHEDRMPQPAEDPDEWVEITDPMHMLRRDVDFTNTRHDTWEPICFWHGQFIGKLHEWGYTDSRFRCRRRDLPKVEQPEQCAACDAPAEPRTAGCKDCNEYATAICSPEPEQWPKYYKIEDTDIAYMIRLSPTKLKYVYKWGYEGTEWEWTEEDEAEHRTEITEAEAMALLKKPQPAEDPDEWVIQDKVPPRAHIDVVFWSHWKHGEEVVAQGTWEHPQVHGFTDCFGHQLSVRCRRRDLPKVEQAEQWPKYYTTIDSPSSDVAFVKRVDETSYSVVYKNGRECPGFLWIDKNQSRRKQLTETEAMALLNPTSNAYFSYHEKQNPQPQKTRVRLWVPREWNSRSAIVSTRIGDKESNLWQEIHHDSEGFYVENSP